MSRWIALGVTMAVAMGCGGSGDGDPTMMEPVVIMEPDAGPPPPPIRVPDMIAPRVFEDMNDDPDIVEVELTASLARITIGDELAYMGMTYNGGVPGPLLQAKVGDEVIVHFRNELDQPTTVHWHGLRISDEMDGNPRIQDPVQPGETFEYRFVMPEAGTFWYHPHVRSNEQLEKGLYGAIVVHDADDPEYDGERVLVLDDILIDPDSETLPPFLVSHPEIMHGRYGNVLLTNGQESDTVRASTRQGQVERWRIINSANARTMLLGMEGATFRVVAVDGGKLAAPYVVNRLQMAVGQRFDLEVSYDQAGEARLFSQVPTTSGRDARIAVLGLDVAETGDVPRAVAWPELEMPAPRDVNREEVLTFNAVAGPTGTQWQLNGITHPEEPLFVFREGDTVRLRLVNQAGPEHPFHLHGQWFEIVSDGSPHTDQPGLKDTVLIPGLQSVEVIAYLDNPGRWMAHCHILEHAALGMMGEIIVEEAQ